jgi:hypothetical protein
MAATWNFMPSFIDVLVSHHEPEHAEHDPHLVEIVAAVEHYLLTRVEDAPAPGEAHSPIQTGTDGIVAPPSARMSRNPFDDSEWPAIAENLDVEYTRLLPIVQSGLKNVVGAN